MLPLYKKSARLTAAVILSTLISQLILMGSGISAARANQQKQPNILFIFTDDHASHAMSCYGSKVNQTPNLDRIAREGMLFNNCFCTNSICGPSRAVILTGKHSHLNGFLQNGNKFDGSQQTFPKILRKNGYQTAMIGKWHLATQPTGFDYSEILVGQGPYYNPPMIRNGERVKHVGYTTDIITDLALDYLKNSRDPKKPFMLMFQHKAPHRNWQPSPKHLHMYDDVTIAEPANLFDDYAGRGTAARQQDMTIAKTMTPNDLKLTPPRNFTPEQLKVWNAAYGPKNEAFRKANLKGKDLVRWKYQRYMKDYLRCIASVDDNVGRMLDYLEATDLAKNTIVIYSSDQGFYLGDHGWFDKRFMYEESFRMPFMVRWPGVIKPGSVNNELVSNLDFAETFLDIAGAKIPDDMQGVSLVPLFKDQANNWRKSLYYHYYEFYNDRRSAHMVRRHNGVRTKRYKLIDFYNLGEWELYDLKKDPHEMKSVYAEPEYAQVVTDLKAELKRLQKQYQVPDDTGSVKKDPPSLYLKPRNSGAAQKKKPVRKK
ncbi:MAG: sulfatase [Gimesia sp.]|nr:sulfatase [Gimesia sp.]